MSSILGQMLFYCIPDCNNKYTETIKKNEIDDLKSKNLPLPEDIKIKSVASVIFTLNAICCAITTTIVYFTLVVFSEKVASTSVYFFEKLNFPPPENAFPSAETIAFRGYVGTCIGVVCVIASRLLAICFKDTATIRYYVSNVPDYESNVRHEKVE